MIPELDYAALFDASPNAYLVLNRDLNIVAANRAYLQATRRQLADLVGRWAWDAFPTDPQTLEQSVASFKRVIATGKADTMPLLRFDIPWSEAEGGFEKRYWSTVHSPVTNEAGDVMFVLQHPIDVTELERLRHPEHAGDSDRQCALTPARTGFFDRARSVHEANLVLKAGSDRLRELFSQAPSFMAILRGPEHRFEMTNAAYNQLVGARNVVGMTARDALREVQGQGLFELLDRVYRTGEPYVGRGVEVFLQPENGEGPPQSRFLDFVYQPIVDADGSVSGIFVEGNDVTEAKKTSDELRQREERLRLVVEGAKDHAILTTDLQGNITSWSHGAAEIFGWSESEVLGKPTAMMFLREDREAGAPSAELAAAAGQGCGNDERWHVRKDGGLVFMNGSVRPLYDASGRPQGFLKIARDETERRKADQSLRELTERLEQRVEERTRELREAEEQLRQAQKMEAIGQLTGGIAHDFNICWPPSGRALN